MRLTSILCCLLGLVAILFGLALIELCRMGETPVTSLPKSSTLPLTERYWDSLSHDAVEKEALLEKLRAAGAV